MRSVRLDTAAVFVTCPHCEEGLPSPSGAPAWTIEDAPEAVVVTCRRCAGVAHLTPPWFTIGGQTALNKGTPLLYCAACAGLINRYNPGACTPEVTP